MRRIFDDYVHGGHSLREIIRRLAADGFPPPAGRDRLWRTSTLSKLLRNEAYIGRIYVNRTEAVPDPRPGKRSKQVPRPREDWITIAVPAILTEETFEAAGRVSRDNSQWSPRRDFATRVLAVIDTLDFDQRQTLLRLVVDDVHVTGWHVQIRLRIPLDDNPDGPPRPPNPDPGPGPARPGVNRRPSAFTW